MSNQGVREIQLNGKQLVFMFMTATVAAVVVFLCGVMVGRGVNTTRASATAAVTAEPTVDPTSTAKALPSTSSDTASSAEPVSNQEDLKELTYAKRLETPEPPPEPAVEPIGAAPVPAVAETESTTSRPSPKRWIRVNRRATVSWCRLPRFVRVRRQMGLPVVSRRKDFPPS